MKSLFGSGWLSELMFDFAIVNQAIRNVALMGKEVNVGIIHPDLSEIKISSRSFI